MTPPGAGWAAPADPPSDGIAPGADRDPGAAGLDQAGSAMRKAAAPKLTQSPARTANPESARHPLTRVPFFEPRSTSTQA